MGILHDRLLHVLRRLKMVLMNPKQGIKWIFIRFFYLYYLRFIKSRSKKNLSPNSLRIYNSLRHAFKYCVLKNVSVDKKKLAFVSPFPPEKTGIADYSAVLLPELSGYFEIELITNLNKKETPEFLSQFQRRSIRWFEKNAYRYDRIIYQFGNSLFHTHMLSLLERHPGVVVLHDFFLGQMLGASWQSPDILLKFLFHSHGYLSAFSYLNAKNRTEINQLKNSYPCSLPILQNAKGVIIHSKFSQDLALKWYGEDAKHHCTVIPLVRDFPPSYLDRLTARKSLGISETSFVICTFGWLSLHKLSHRLLEAWLSSGLKDQDCELVFVGGHHGGDYMESFFDSIKSSPYQNKIKVTGWNEPSAYINYLQAADIAVQLRTLSRGETSAAVLDCMAYGLPTIVNSHGSMAELPSEAVWMVPDEFTNQELVNALEKLWGDSSQRKLISDNAKKHVATAHHPQACALLYKETIESIYQKRTNDLYEWVKAAALKKSFRRSHFKSVAQKQAALFKPFPSYRQLLVDVTSVAENDLKTGIQRVVRAQLSELIKNPPEGFRVEPVYLSYETGGSWRYRYARQYLFKMFGASTQSTFQDTVVDVYPGDVFYALDLVHHKIICAAQEGLFLNWRSLGVQMNVLVYDLLPILKPEFFPENVNEIHKKWLVTAAQFADRLIGISYSVKDEIYDWLEKNPVDRTDPLKIAAAPLGADIQASIPSYGISSNAKEILKKMRENLTFLMVGTIEPRKGYFQALEAFEYLWNEGYQVLLVIVGKEGWLQLPKNQRCTILSIVDKIKKSPELGKRLFWLEDVSDEYLQQIYTASTCFLFASEGEGFGLPLMEAAHYNLPIIVRDLPIFREVTEQKAYYFNGLTGGALAETLKSWISQDALDPSLRDQSSHIKWNSWAENVRLLKIILEGKGQEQCWFPVSH